MDVWRLGGAPEVEARAVARGDDEAERCAAPAKTLKNRKGRKDCQNGACRCEAPNLPRLPPITQIKAD